MSAPPIVTIRPGVEFEPAAAASWQRMERAAGRAIDVNSSYRDYDEQMDAYNAYLAYLNGGPWAPYALHPDQSVHCQGRAVDSDDQSLLKSLATHGWRQTALAVGEPWHFEYFSSNDQHIGEPADTGDPIPFPGEEQEEMAPTLKGCWYTRTSDKAHVNLHFNEASGFYYEFTSGGGKYNDDIAKAWETNFWPEITESHAGAIKRALDKVLSN